MLTSYKFAALTASVLLAVLAPLAPAALAAESLCKPAERVIFTCPTGKKIISVCASQEYGPETGFLQYRFGPEDEPELTLPAEKEVPSKSAQSGLWSFAGGGGAYIRFSGSADTAYYVYAAIGKWGAQGKTTERAGAAVQKGDRVIADIRCRSREQSELGPEFFTKAGLLEVENEFVLP